ncbi:MAG TPA: alpha-glucan family phosphorylase [Rubrobacteraceae bacterium]|nr:alpha-glucan family phosphorylase [Rubrobacteraceae bacterium]
MTSTIPSRLERLPELAQNLLWTWRPGIQKLFAGLDPDLWETTEHNPVRLLNETSNLEAAAEDAAFIEDYQSALQDLDSYLDRRGTWMDRVYPDLGGPVAYFSAEFGLHECLPIYSGGLGVLAGDHVKSASDLGVPLVGVGLLYSEGYFRQRLDAGGLQQEVYEPFDPENRPVLPARDAGGREIHVTVPLAGREVRLKVWEVKVGRVSLLLLDANVPENAGGDRGITARLYGGDTHTRISQELILGVGGVRALRALDLHPAVFHMNEGHAAFSVLERMRALVADGASFDEARERVYRDTVFTTHTPVPAGHDHFPRDLFEEYTAGWPEDLGTDREGLWNLGRKEEEWGETFNMTVLAMNLSAARNAVSELHRDVSLEMWEYLFSKNGRRPITHVTNGIHTWSWLSPALYGLFERHSGGRAWRAAVEDASAWSFVEEIPDRDLWEAHRSEKRAMTDFVNRRLQLQRERTGSSTPAQKLDPEALTLGFARRFATYKRATLLLHDAERLRLIVKGADRPVQFVFAGKAHPADEPAKEFIRSLYGAAGEEDLAGHIVILEDYDMNVARHLVQGVDVWLNNPRRPLEASGTSGQKASLNGAPNFSVLDGWWPEAYNGKNGWKIGEEKEYASQEEQDAADSESLYTTLEEALIPLYYTRDEAGVPGGWIEVMKEAISTVAPIFSTQRMVQDYVHKLYVPRANGDGVS